MAYNGGTHFIFSLTRKSKMGNTVGSLTESQRSIIIGTILGDGYVRIVSGRKDAFLEINHSISQKEYVDWKYEMLQTICKSGPTARKGNGARIAYRFTTRQHPEITELFTSFYQEGEKVIPDNIELNPLMLAVWFMDDGSFCRASDVYINTQQFAHTHQERLQEMLASLGIETTLNKDKDYERIRIRTSSIPTLYRTVSPHIIPSMTYKIQL